MSKPDLNLGVVGNCTFAALINRRARCVWGCLPRLDGDPIFSSLLHDNERGFYDVLLEDFSHSEQYYIENTAILVTRLYDTHGRSVEVTDFAPRFEQYDRFYRPTTLVRMLRPVDGTPRVTVRLRPTHTYGSGTATVTHGSNHIRYITPGIVLRLTTDLPVSFILEETPFLLEEPVNLILGPDESLTRSVAETAREFCEKTHDYWRRYSRLLSIPFEWQEAVIRAAITLKLSSFEESGAIVAAMTTSIPEGPDTGRNWDYRYCWLRDAYFVLHALNRLGATRTMEQYIRYISNIAAGAEEGYLQPVYGIMLERELPERTVDSLPGYRGMGPVRVGNLAYKQVQNDGYGSVVLAATQAFFDRRIFHPGNGELFERLERLGEQAVSRAVQPDAGLWELRETQRVHTFSSVMCWAACDRLGRIANKLNRGDRQEYWREQADVIRERVCLEAWNEKRESFVDSFGGERVDASLLLLPTLGFIEARDPRFVATLERIEAELLRHGFLFRYAEDEFGSPSTSFNICTFWYIEALAQVGRVDEARELFERMLESRNHLGLLSEDLDPTTGELWGNFPQTYSMVGLINAAMRLSIPWEEAL